MQLTTDLTNIIGFGTVLSNMDTWRLAHLATLKRSSHNSTHHLPQSDKKNNLMHACYSNLAKLLCTAPLVSLMLEVQTNLK